MHNESSNLSAWSRAVRESTLKRLRLVPAGKENWRPVSGAMGVAGIAQHILDADLWLFRKLQEPTLQAMKDVDPAYNVASYADFLAILSNLQRTAEERSTLIQELTLSDLARTMPDERFGPEISVWWEIVRGNLDHETHHRGQLAAYLRMAHILTT
jgi:uncharacterized damage-inducible protein DinB